MARAGDEEPQQDLPAQVRAVMRAAQALVGIVVGSLSEVEGIVSVPQFRILVIIANQGPLNVNALAGAARVHPSNATRACDPLVTRGLLARQESTVDRRQVQLKLTDHGRDVLRSVLRHRETAISEILSRMAPSPRADFVVALESFCAAAGDVIDDSLWQWDPSIG
ncbi:MAG TPA: MarR family transcriptional regulator [Pseudonocardiaceae bacterium]|jgi:DNA-binding MarR family transcriptional regulator